MLEYSLIDNGCGGQVTVIDEPVGWDAIAMRLKRESKVGWHGFFDFFEDPDASMQFDGLAHRILKAAYESKGAAALVEILIKFKCSDTDPYVELYRGRFVFTRYKDFCSDRCYCSIGVENTNSLMQFRNRYDQKVDLDSLKPFDDDNCTCAEVEVDGGFNGATRQIIITSVSGGTPGDLCGLHAGQSITVTDSDSNDGIYTIVSVGLGGGSTSITVEENLVDEGPFSAFKIFGCIYCIEEMEEYAGLDKKINLPPKKLVFRNDWESKVPYSIAYTDALLFGELSGTAGTYFFSFDWDIDNLTEIEDSSRVKSEYAELSPGGPPGSPIDNYTDVYDGVVKYNLNTALLCTTEAKITIRLEGAVSIDTNDTVQFNGDINLRYGSNEHGWINVNLATGLGCAGCSSNTDTFNINYSNNITLRKGDRIYIHFIATNFQYTTGPTDAFQLSIDITAAHFTLEAASACEFTPARVYMINEVMSRCTEAYTNDNLRVYSDYFGRPDAQPYTSSENGCGAMECITSGLKIRSKESNRVPIGDALVIPKVTVSLKEVFEAMTAIHNIGMGIEPDPNRAGYDLIRVEPRNYFYQDVVLMTCDHVAAVEREMIAENILSIFKAGYSKWETENINGLNDVFGKREYRTTLSAQSNVLEKICRFVASDYAMEITRRQYGSTSKDWRYDNDIFVICLANYFKGSICFQNPTLIQVFTYVDVVVGDTLEISGSVSNNGAFTVTNVVHGGDIYNSTYISVAEAVTTECTLPNHITLIRTSPNQLYMVEQGMQQENVVSSNDILYPDYCYNLRITPARNAMRWIKTILQSYRQWLTGILKFTNGEGNFIAETQLVSDGCLNEDDSVIENEDIELNDFNTPEDHYPRFYAERVKFEYAMSYEQYLTVKATPYGLIEFQCGDQPMEQGWIEDMQYKPYSGMASFTLKTKIPS